MNKSLLATIVAAAVSFSASALPINDLGAPASSAWDQTSVNSLISQYNNQAIGIGNGASTLAPATALDGITPLPRQTLPPNALCVNPFGMPGFNTWHLGRHGGNNGGSNGGSVPDGGTTLVLMSMGLSCIGLFVWKKKA